MSSAVTETFEQTIARHKQEKLELDTKAKAMLKSAKKSEKAVIEAQIIQMQYDLKANQNEELDRFEENGYTMMAHHE